MRLIGVDVQQAAIENVCRERMRCLMDCDDAGNIWRQRRTTSVDDSRDVGRAQPPVRASSDASRVANSLRDSRRCLATASNRCGVQSLQVRVVAEVMADDSLYIVDCRHWNRDMPIETTRAPHCGIDLLRQIRCGDDDDSIARLGTVQKRQPSVYNRAVPRVRVAVSTAGTDAVDLIDGKTVSSPISSVVRAVFSAIACSISA